MGISQVTSLLAAVIEDSLVHPSTVSGSFDFVKADGRWEKLCRLDGELPFTAIAGSPNADATKIMTVYRSDDAAFVEIGEGVDFIEG